MWNDLLVKQFLPLLVSATLMSVEKEDNVGPLCNDVTLHSVKNFLVFE